MEWRPIITPDELVNSYSFFSSLRNPSYSKAVRFLLKKIENFIGRPIGIALPPDVEHFLGNPESLRALRLLEKLRDYGLVGSFYPNRHNYGDEPHGHVTMASLKNYKKLGFSGKGTDMFDRSKTLWPAVGEVVERYTIQNHYPKEGEYLDASYESLNEPKADIFNVAGFDDGLRAAQHPEFELKYDERNQFRWAKARLLPSEKEIWAPLQWFSFSHVQRFVNKRPGYTPEPLLSIPITTGVATGQNRTDAILRGLLEVIERDAFIIYWLNQIAAKRIDLKSLGDTKIEEMAEIAGRYGLELYALYLKTDMPAHTVCCVLIDRSGIGPAVTVGAKTSLNLTDSVYSAISDTLSQRGLCRKMMDNPEYSSQDFSDLSKIGHVERMYYWYNPDRLQDIAQFISGEFISAPELPQYEYSGDNSLDLQKLLVTFEAKKYPVLYRELLDEQLQTMTEGLSVTMVKVPLMQPLSLMESLPTLAGNRLYEIPKLLGYEPKRDQSEFCKQPHPFP